MKRLLSLWLVVCLLCTGLTGCGDDGTGKGFRFPIEEEPEGLDPQMATDAPSVTVVAALFEGLTRLDADGAVVPGAADWVVSQDGLTYTFTLRDSKWSALSGADQETPWDEPTPVTAQDFVFGWQRAVDPKTGSPLAAEFDGIKNAKAIRTGKKKLSALGVKATDEKTLVVTLEQPDDDFPARLATTPFMPCNQAFFEYTGGRYGLEEQYVLTNGAFWLAAWNHNESLLTYKHESYHDAAAVAPEAVRFVIGTKNPVAALKKGDLDAAPLTAAQAEKAGDSLQTYPLRDSLRSLWFNTASAPFAGVHLRRALRDSIEWSVLESLLSEQGGDEARAKGFVPPEAVLSGTELYRTDQNSLTYKTDATAAKTSLKKGLAALDTDKLRFELLAADDPDSADLARYLVQSWQKNLGVYPTLTLLPEADLNRRVQSGNYQAAIAVHTPAGRTGAENLSCFATDAAGNLANFRNKTVDAAVNKALSGGRKELQALEQTLWDLCPCVPLGDITRHYAVAAGVERLVPRPFGGGRYSAPLYFREALKME